jgi:hypothetical protein
VVVVVVGVDVATGGGSESVVVATGNDVLEKLNEKSKASTVYAYVVDGVSPVSV